MAAGSIVWELILRTGSFQTDTARAEKAMRQLQKTATSAAKSIGSGFAGSLAGLAAGFFSLQAGFQIFSEAINQADRLDELSARLSISTERLSEWGYAAKLSGTDLESLTGSLTKFSKNVAGALDSGSSGGKLFTTLGINIKDAEGNLRSVESLLPEVADRFKSLDNATLETALAMELFGKSGAEMLEFLNKGSDGIDQLAQKARDLGIVITPEQADAAAKFKDELDNLRAAGQGLATKVSAELLPALTELVKLTSDWVKDGSNAAQVADTLEKTFTLLGSALSFANTFFEGIGNVIEGVTEGMYGLAIAAQGVIGLDWGKIKAGIGVAQEGADLAYYGRTAVGPDAFKGVTGGRSTDKFSDVVGGMSSSSGRTDPGLESRLNKFFATGSGGKSGKSDAEKQAERLAKATREMTKAQREWQTELDGTGSQVADAYSQRLDEITSKAEKFLADGIPTDKVEAFRSAMTKLAEGLRSKELTEFQTQFEFATNSLAASINGNVSPALLRYTEDVRKLNEIMKSGDITQQQYQERLEALSLQRNEDAIRLQKDALFEIELLGKTRNEQELLNEARRLGVDAATEEGQAALQALQNLQAARDNMDDQIAAMDGLRSATRGLFSDLKDGVGVWDSLKNAADSFADVLFDLAAKNVIKQLFGETGSAGGGSSGGFLNSLFGAFFGGGRAGGGDTMPNRSYLVGEHGPEMFIPRTAGTVIPAGPTGAMMSGGDGNRTVNQTFIVTGDNSRRTALQMEQKAGLAAQRAMARNS
jgi:hypothetical protein